MSIGVGAAGVVGCREVAAVTGPVVERSGSGPARAASEGIAVGLGCAVGAGFAGAVVSEVGAGLAAATSAAVVGAGEGVSVAEMGSGEADALGAAEVSVDVMAVMGAGVGLAAAVSAGVESVSEPGSGSGVLVGPMMRLCRAPGVLFSQVASGRRFDQSMSPALITAQNTTSQEWALGGLLCMSFISLRKWVLRK